MTGVTALTCSKSAATTIGRREFLALAAAGVAAHGCRAAEEPRTASPRRVKAIAFDAFPIFDPRPVVALAESLFPGKGAELCSAWRTRQFEYQWLSTLAGRYADFWSTTESALVFAARLLKLELTSQTQDRLMQAYLRLEAWPDVPDALRSLNEAGFRLALLSNMTSDMLDASIRNAGLAGQFECVLSTDRIGAHKPDPRAYRMATRAFGLERESILFAAFAGWDVAGARWFGYPTFWVNRLDAPGEELGPAADATGRDLGDVVRFVDAQRARSDRPPDRRAEHTR